MKFLKIPRKMAETTRQELAEAGIISNDYDIFSEGAFVFIPVKGEFKDFELVERDAEKRGPEPKSLAGALIESLEEDELRKLTTSFDIIGDIAIVEIPEELEGKENDIGEALLKVHRNVRSVFKKLGPMEGEYRVRKLGLIAGEDRTETVYRESGVNIMLDVSKVYFSVRLSHERERIAEKVKPGEKILVLFAGVGPFALVIAKKHPDAEIVAVEINPDAVAYMKKNIELNGFGNVTALEGDARDAARDYRDFDRVIMPLPKSAHEFLDVAFDSVKDGGIIHFYTIADSQNPFDDAMDKVEEALVENRQVLQAISVSKRIVRPYSPDLVQVVMDLLVRKR